jgi:hypothetical protein
MGLYDNSTDEPESPTGSGFADTSILGTPRLSAFVYESELRHFTNWLQAFQPGFADLPEVEIELKSREAFEHFLQHGSLPPLPEESKNRIRLVYQGRSLQAIATPKPSVMWWVRKLESQLLQNCLSKTVNNADLVIEELRVQLDQLLNHRHIDNYVVIYLRYAIKTKFNTLLGVFHLVYHLFIHTLEACLFNLNVNKTGQILALVKEIFMKRGYTYMAIFSDEHLIELIIEALRPSIRNSHPETIENINLALRHATRPATVLEVSTSLLSHFLRYPRWGNGCLASRVTVIIGSPSDDHEQDPASQARLAILNSLTVEEWIELYIRLLVPKSSRSYHFAIKATVGYLFARQPLVHTVGGRTEPKCTYEDILYEEQIGQIRVPLILRSSDF